MKPLRWETIHPNPRMHYLYRGHAFLGLVSMVGTPGTLKGYSVYVRREEDDTSVLQNAYITTVSTLDEAKGLLETIAGANS
ncbi:MAG: hypothetical protein ACKO0Z_05760 [Betaproteobacteria bacterium]